MDENQGFASTPGTIRKKKRRQILMGTTYLKKKKRQILMDTTYLKRNKMGEKQGLQLSINPSGPLE